MLIYRFKPHERNDRRVALTSDQSGATLPADGAPWQPIGQVDLDENGPWIKVPKADIEAAITKNGYFIWSIAIKEPRGPRGRQSRAGREPRGSR